METGRGGVKLSIISDIRNVRDQADLSKLYELYERCDPVEDPDGPRPARLQDVYGNNASPVRGLLHGLRNFVGWWSEHSGDVDQVVQLATARDGAAIGGLVLELPRYDYTHVAFCFLVVAPENRRRGIGRELLREAARHAEAASRTSMIFYSRDGSPAEGFIRALGCRPAGPTDTRRVLELSDATQEDLSARRATVRASGDYRLLHWTGYLERGYLTGLARLFDAMADAPRPQTMPAEAWTAERVRHNEEELIGRGTRLIRLMAVHEKTDQPAAFTEVIFDDAIPGWGFQGATVVLPEHRGKDLGFFVKSALYEFICDTHPAITHMMTTNNATNPRIVALNERLGFRYTASFTPWELSGDALRGAAAHNLGSAV